jgi:hypothetical protein
VIEINSLVPPGIYWSHGARTAGNTFSRTVKIGIKRGYTLVCHTGNLIFVKNELMYQLDFPTKFVKNPELLFLERWIFEDSYSMYRKAQIKGLIISLLPQLILPISKKLKLILLKP